MKTLSKTLVLLLLLTLAVPSGAAWAYSYGDPNSDDVPESFKEIAVKLNTNPPDWNAAYEIYKVRRAEISSHFEESVAVTLDANFQMKNKDLLIANFKAVLVMNLKRRFDYALKDINQYSAAKLLLAKAKGTFDVLQPYIKDDTKSLAAAFDAALEALGNPGLFGVGEKPVKPEEFKKQVDYIYQTVLLLFPYKEAKKEEPAKEQTNTGNSSASPKPAESSAPANNQAAAANTSTQPAKDGAPAAKAQQTVAESKDAAKTDSSAAAVNEAATEKSAASEPALKPADSEKESALSPGIAEPEKAEQTVTAEVTHAPMQRSDKTNPIVSVIIIVFVVLLGTGGFWFARKKGLF